MPTARVRLSAARTPPRTVLARALARGAGVAVVGSAARAPRVRAQRHHHGQRLCPARGAALSGRSAPRAGRARRGRAAADHAINRRASPGLGGGSPTSLCPRIGSRGRGPRCQFRRRTTGIGPSHHPRYGRHHGQGGHDRRGSHRPQPRVRGGCLAVRGQPAHRWRGRVDPGTQHRHRRSGGRRW